MPDHLVHLRACKVAIYSESDRLQPHRYKADESYAVGPPDAEPVQSYLDIEVRV